MQANQEISPIFIAAHLWQSHGWQVIPAQPNSKKLVRGFGLYQNKAESGEQVNFWFQEKRVNLVVVAPEEGVILDFDKPEVYEIFCERWPAVAASYTESTPRGGKHIFLRTSRKIPPGLVLVPGIEVKKIVLVYPSKVAGRPYGISVAGKILQANVLEALQPFIEPGHNSHLAALAPVLGLPVGKQGYKNGFPAKFGLIEKIKARWPIQVYLHHFEPNLYLHGHGNFLSAKCPWHTDQKPSLWVNIKNNTWGCHACGAHGDVLNWHARRMGSQDWLRVARDLEQEKGEVLA